MSLLYPVAATAEAALHAPLGHAVREREAAAIAAAAVGFVTEAVGPAFATREAALQAYPGADEPGWRQLAPVGPDGVAPPLVKPSYRDGRRWPEMEAVAPVLWRLQVSYWRIGGRPQVQVPLEPARKLRRTRGGRALEGGSLNALARQPMRAMKPQQPLDIGLFEVRRPEAPDILIPDE